jgi:MFS transporter, FSR family, fosmidomycin resistance protein
VSDARPVFIFACIGHALFHILVALLFTLALVLQPAWAVSYNDLIALWTFGALLLGAGAPIAGWLGDRYGETRLMIVYFLGIGLSCIACGLSRGTSDLWIGLTFMGLFGSIYHPVGTAWIVKHAQKRGRAIATVGICGSLGVALAAAVAGALSDLSSWRAAFFIPGGVTVMAGLALLVSYARGSIVDRGVDRVASLPVTASDVRRAFAGLVVAMALTSLLYQAFSTMLPKWIEREIGAALGTGLVGLGMLVMLIYLVGATAQLVGGFLSDRGWTREAYIAGFVLKLAAFAAAMVVGDWVVVLAAIAISFAFDIAAPIETVLIARFTASRRRGLAYGVRHGIGIAAAPLGVQLVAAQFNPSTGFRPLLVSLCVITAIGLLAALFLPRDKVSEAEATSCRRIAEREN